MSRTWKRLGIGALALIVLTGGLYAAYSRVMLAAKATLYALPLVIVDVTREETFSNRAASDATPNRFLHIPILANASFRTVVRPNADTLYSTAWLDLGREPVVLTIPPGNGRFFMIQCMDAWTNVFADRGIRALGDKAATYAIVGPDWHGRLPAGMEELRAPTRLAWVVGRVFARNQADLPAAREFQRQLDIRPLSRLDDTSFKPAYPHRTGANNQHTAMDLLQRKGARAFFERFMTLTVANPAVPPDPRFEASVLVPLGFTAGRPKSWESIGFLDRCALAIAYNLVLHRFSDRVSLKRDHQTVNGWSGPAGKPEDGRFGADYQRRAAVAMIGLAAKVRADGTIFNANVDVNGERLDGNQSYRLTFRPGATPPVKGFWSLTLYDDEGYLVANPLNRYAIRPGEGLAFEPDGSLVLYLQPDDPGPARRANWLPAPRGRTYELSLRTYWPEEAVLDGRWFPPPVMPARAPEWYPVD